MVVQLGGIERATKCRQCVEQTGDVIHHGRVVIFPPGLVLLGTVVVVDRIEHTAGLLRCRTQQKGGFAAIRADLDADSAAEVPQRCVVQRTPLVGRHETLYLFGQREQALGRIHVDVAHELNLSSRVTPPAPWSLFALSDHPRSVYRLSSARSGFALPSSACVTCLSANWLVLPSPRSRPQPP